MAGTHQQTESNRTHVSGLVPTKIPRISGKATDGQIRCKLALSCEERNVFKKTPKRDLEPPPIASSNSQAVEILRVWAAPGQPQQLTLRTTWKDAGAWGLLLADVARHAANEGQNSAEVLARIQ